ncbi:SulP family inorganic anion transporter [Aeromicrobium sp. IC_218]|uniref:SulP family inorganic anion transporter n=1 Tax=Aeromicrobium sp. IC_218 TaxID=2545468 RepID=UPI00103B1757|nr:SulP family inorganic anion transporter [Aeromicrobium sp. IC_218]TCI97625.1 SulP family inorganic anion transporter [Aeromicrobium sp. IC_218]
MSPAARAIRRAATILQSLRPRRSDLRADALAGLPQAISTVPDGMASAVLVGVNPAYGLYAGFAGPIGGGLTTSTKLMVVTTTTAAALAAGSALDGLSAPERDSALVLLTLLSGLLMIAAGVLRLGRYVRFVSHSVMLGFLTGVAVNITLGQLPDLVGAPSEGSLNVTKAWHALTHLGAISWPAAAAGLGAVAIMAALSRTRFELMGSLLAVVVPTAVAVASGTDRIATVADAGEIPRGVPPLVLPTLSDLSWELVGGALAIAAIVLVQGAGVAQSAPNPDGTPSRINVDFVGQGVANLGSGVFHGIPIGGSVSATALSRAAGARSRWAAILAGAWMLLILVALAGVVGHVVMPTLAAVLMYAGVMSVRPADLLEVLRTSTISRVALVGTFVATLVLPVAAAVGVGVLVSLLLQLNKDALDLRVVRLVPHAGDLVETDPPAVLPDREPVVLDVYGSLLYAGSRTLEARLPDPGDADRPVVVLRLRGRTSLGSTFFAVMAAYAADLHDRGGLLYLSGVSPDVVERFQHTQALDVQGMIRIFRARPALGRSTGAAFAEASSWLVEPRPGRPDLG